MAGTQRSVRAFPFRCRSSRLSAAGGRSSRNSWPGKIDRIFRDLASLDVTGRSGTAEIDLAKAARLSFEVTGDSVTTMLRATVEGFPPWLPAQSQFGRRQGPKPGERVLDARMVRASDKATVSLNEITRGKAFTRLLFGGASGGSRRPKLRRRLASGASFPQTFPPISLNCQNAATSISICAAPPARPWQSCPLR